MRASYDRLSASERASYDRFVEMASEMPDVPAASGVVWWLQCLWNWFLPLRQACWALHGGSAAVNRDLLCAGTCCELLVDQLLGIPLLILICCEKKAIAQKWILK